MNLVIFLTANRLDNFEVKSLVLGPPKSLKLNLKSFAGFCNSSKQTLQRKHNIMFSDQIRSDFKLPSASLHVLY